MRSLPKVIKQGGVSPSEEVYKIPDKDPPPAPKKPKEPQNPEDPEELDEAKEGEEETVAEEEEEQEPEPEPGPDLDKLQRELEEKEKAAKKRLERLTREAKEQAEAMSQKILQSAKSESSRLMEQAKADVGRIREEAYKKGREEGLSEKRVEIESKLGELDRLMERLSQEQETFLRQYQEGLAALSLEIAQKVLDEAVMADDTLMRPLVRKAVSSVKNAEWISVEVSSALPGLVEGLKKELVGRPGMPRMDIQASELPPGGCRVHTPEGMVDASVSTQLGNLRSLFDGPARPQ